MNQGLQILNGVMVVTILKCSSLDNIVQKNIHTNYILTHFTQTYNHRYWRLKHSRNILPFCKRMKHHISNFWNHEKKSFILIRRSKYVFVPMTGILPIFGTYRFLILKNMDVEKLYTVKIKVPHIQSTILIHYVLKAWRSSRINFRDGKTIEIHELLYVVFIILNSFWNKINFRCICAYGRDHMSSKTLY